MRSSRAGFVYRAGASWWQTIFEHTATPTGFYTSRLTFWGGILANGGWQIVRKDGTVYTFGHMAPLQAIRDRYGNEIRFTWSTTNTFGSGTGNLLRVTSPNGRWIEFTYYTGTNRVYQAKDTIGRTVTYTYDANGRLSTVTDPENHVTSHTWDANNRMLTVKPTHLQGTQTNLVTNEYTTAADAPTPVGWVKKQTHADGGVYQFAYTIANGKSTQTDVTDPLGRMRRVTFNPEGYTLDDTRALGTSEEQRTQSVRQTSGNFVTSSTDALNRPTTTTYDDNGSTTSVTQLTGSEAVTTTYTYAAFDQVATITDPLTHTTTFAYDAKGNRTSVTDALNHATTFGYNSAGQVTSVTDPLQHTTTFEYTGPDVTKITDSLGRMTQRFFDAAGRLLAQTDPLGQIARFEYDRVNHLTRVTDPLSAVTTYGYDTAGRLGIVTDARNNPTTYGYDVFNRLASRTDPLSKTETFTYDVNGNPSQRLDRKGQVTTRSYDSLNRLYLITFADTSTITYTYDSGSRLTTIADSLNGTITRTYDNLDRLTSEVTAQGTVTYTYDAADRRATMTVAGQPTVTYDYDNANRLTTVTQGTSAVTLNYDEADRRSTLTLPNGIVVASAYDIGNQLTGLTYALGQTTLGTLTYAYDLAARRTEVGGTWARTGLPTAVATTSYDAANRLTGWVGGLYAYDANGNAGSEGLTGYTWDARDQLTAVNGNAIATFAYDGVGRRRSKSVGTTTTGFLYDGINFVQEQSSGGTPTAILLTGINIDETFIRSDGNGVSTFLTDALGSTVALADNLGIVQTQYTFEPFGETTSTGTANANASQFSGRENDGTGIYDYRARYLDPSIGRFISEDPIGLAGGDANFYRYAFGNPVTRTDPLGLDVLLCSRPMNNVPGSQLLNLPHVFIYTPLLKGVGFGPKGWNIPGFPDAGQIEREDPFNPNGSLKPGNSCPAVSKSKCVEDCVNDALKNAINNPPPIFKIAPLSLGGYQCSDFADQVMNKCNAQCSGR